MNTPAATTARTTKLTFDAVSKRFGQVSSAPLVLDAIELTVAEGEFVAVLGPSGCGKSTLLNIVAGLTPATSGQVRVADQPVTGPGPDRGVLFQDYALFPWKSVRANIEFGLRYGPKNKRPPSAAARKDLVAKYVDLVGLGGAESKYPRQLSGGMRQRTALARLWAPDPDVLLMDEPLAALDAQTRLVMQDELLRIWGQELPWSQRKTVLYVTHSIDEAVFLSDRIAVLGAKPGRIREVVDIDLPRPRGEAARADPRFEELHHTIWNLIRDEAFDATIGV
jgi:NitT/TauT family transport system ATP-binding protein